MRFFVAAIVIALAGLGNEPFIGLMVVIWLCLSKISSQLDAIERREKPWKVT